MGRFQPRAGMTHFMRHTLRHKARIRMRELCQKAQQSRASWNKTKIMLFAQCSSAKPKVLQGQGGFPVNCRKNNELTKGFYDNAEEQYAILMNL